MKKPVISFFVLHFSFFTFHSGEAQVIHVPGPDSLTIQQGIELANPGDTVLVDSGIYYEQINFLGKKPLMVASRYLDTGDTNHINNTIIDGSQLSNMDNASVVYFTMGEDTTSVLYGFRISGGKGTYVFSGSDRCGGGIFISGSGAKIAHNLITGNIVDDSQSVNGEDAFGGGIGTVNQDGDYWVVIENNRIRNNTTVSQYEWSAGGGIFISYNARIAGNYIADNICHTIGSGWATGGGITHLGAEGSPNLLFIHNNKILHNSATTSGIGMGSDGALAMTFAQMIFTDNEVIDNYAETPGGIGGIGAMSVIDPAEGCVISGNIFKENISTNVAGAILLENFYGTELNEVLVSGNYFIGNTAEQGGAIYDFNIPVVFENNVFSGNHASDRGGALMLWNNATDVPSHQVILINNSFCDNVTGNYGGAIYSYKARPLVFNTIFYNNPAGADGSEIYLAHVQDTLDIANSNIDMGLISGSGNIYDGQGNISEDPKFDDRELLTLKNESPCLEAGTISYTCKCGYTHDCPDFDIDGYPRPQHDLIDMGAHEYLFAETEEPADRSSQLAVRCYPNPTSGIVDFRFSILDSRWVSLKIYDLNGREVATVLDGRCSGDQVVRWDASSLPTGVYFFQLRAKGIEQGAAGKIVKF